MAILILMVALALFLPALLPLLAALVSIFATLKRDTTGQPRILKPTSDTWQAGARFVPPCRHREQRRPCPVSQLAGESSFPGGQASNSLMTFAGSTPVRRWSSPW